jgi:hypothetical protein
MAWLPADFIHPTRVRICDGNHLRPVTAADDLDYPAVMGSQPRLWSIFGPAWGWPPASMTYQQDREDLARQGAEIMTRQSFNYALFNDAQTTLLGCVYIGPPEKQPRAAWVPAWPAGGWWTADRHQPAPRASLLAPDPCKQIQLRWRHLASARCAAHDSLIRQRLTISAAH